jgi:hypothetical protein
MSEKQVARTSKKTAKPATPVSPFDSLADAEPVSDSRASKPRVRQAAGPDEKPGAVKSGKTAKAVKGTRRPSSQTSAKRSKDTTLAAAAKKETGADDASPFSATAANGADTKRNGKKPELSPVLKTLAEPVLPPLERENRARLMMQTPTELYFYWSVRENPYQLLRNAFGSDTGSYTLVVKLTNLNTGEEEIYPAEAEGNWWFHVGPNGRYEAEIGFYATNRPYFRIIYSNEVETPRRGPSPHPATEAVWTVSANKFAAVLDVAGFTADAVDVAMAGDDHQSAETATRTAFSRFAGVDKGGVTDIAGEDMRYALRALASGVALEELRYTIGSKLFAILKERSADMSSQKAVDALAESFDIPESEYIEEAEGTAVFGASLVNFPRSRRPRHRDDRFTGPGSHSYHSSFSGR